MTRIQRWKVALAQVLLADTEYEVARTEKVLAVRDGITSLRRYVQMSGGLCEPRRIRARRAITRYTDELTDNAAAIRVLA